MSAIKRVMLLAASVLSLGLVFVPADAASADHFPNQGSTGRCPGNLVGVYDLDVGGTKIGELAIYWYESGGYNCARMNHYGPTVGQRRWTEVHLWSCEQRTPSQSCTIANSDGNDEGNFVEYAGRVFVHARNRCIHAFGYIRYGGEDRYVSARDRNGNIAIHCG